MPTHRHPDLTRFLVDEKGLVAPPKDAELTAGATNSIRPALANTIRWAHTVIGKPIYITENGIGTDDDTRASPSSTRRCRRARLPRRRHSGAFLSLTVPARQFRMDSGYDKHFGLVAVDLQTFKRTLKPSALHLGAIARANRI